MKQKNNELRVELDKLHSQAIRDFLINLNYLATHREEVEIIKTPQKGEKKVLIDVVNLRKDFG
ncbi:MAG: hypothetical protein ACRC7B_01725, partial [Metamycoplasmataceae bacterium]